MDITNYYGVVGPEGCMGILTWEENIEVWNAACTDLRGVYCSVFRCLLAATPWEFCVLDESGTVTMLDTRGRVRRRWSYHGLRACAMTVSGNWVYVFGTDDFAYPLAVHVYDVQNGHLQHSFWLETIFFSNITTIIADELFVLEVGFFGNMVVCVFSTTDGSLLRQWACDDGTNLITNSASGHLWAETPTKLTCFRPDGTQCDPFPPSSSPRATNCCVVGKQPS